MSWIKELLESKAWKETETREDAVHEEDVRLAKEATMTPQKDTRDTYVCDSCESHFLSYEGDVCPYCNSTDTIRK